MGFFLLLFLNSLSYLCKKGKHFSPYIHKMALKNNSM